MGQGSPINDGEMYEFGATVADQMNAFLQGDRREAAPSRLPAQMPGGSIEACDYRKKLESMSPDDRVSATLECLGRRGTFRDILYGLLVFCQDEKTYPEIEAHVREFAEFHRNRQSERRYVHLLLRTGALEEIELDEDGEVLTETAKQRAVEEGLDPEDLDLLVCDWRVVTTEVGKRALAEFSPESRMRALLEGSPGKVEALLQVLAFCETPRFMGDVVEHFQGADVLGFDEGTRQPIQPSSYMDKLDKAGMVAWNGSYWRATDEGRAFLREYRVA